MIGNQINGGEALARMLRAFGVETVFGLCGDTSLPFYDALFRTGDGIRHVLTRDERHAGYMADAYARVSSRVGVCEGPSGGGATYLAPGLVEANESSIPVLALTTDISVSSRGRYTLTELDQTALYGPLTKSTAMVDQAADLPRQVRAAFRTMTTGRPGAAHLGLPYDVQTQPVEEDAVWAEPRYGSFPAQRVAPDPEDVEVAATAIAASERPLLICGGGVIASGAETALAALAERIGAPVATTISGKGSISDGHGLALGVVGSNGGTPPTRRVVDDADLIVFVACRAGSVTTERWMHPVPGSVPVVHIDVDPAVIGANYPPAAAMVGDARLCLEALAAAVDRRDAGAARRRVSEAREEKASAFAALAASDAAPVLPERIVAELRRALPADAVLVADPGTPCPYFSAYYDLPEAGRHFISNRAHGALGYALPASVGAHFGRPGKKCVAVMGDGSFGMAAGELETVRRLGLPVTMVVIANGSYGWIKAGQKAGFQERYFSVDFTTTDHAAVARAFGVRAWSVSEPAELAPALAEAVAADEPTLVDIAAQPLHEARAPVSEWVA